MRIAIVGNGDYFNCRKLLQVYDLVMAADGGANHCRKMHLTPDYTIGDGDSYQGKMLLQADQSTTDLQKAIQLAKQITPKNYLLDLFCVTSHTRLDHTLAAFHLLMYEPHVYSITTPTQIIYYLAATETLTLKQSKGLILSIVPCSTKVTITLTGLKWSGKNITLSTKRSGISNQVTKSNAIIRVHTGKALLMINRKRAIPLPHCFWH